MRIDAHHHLWQLGQFDYEWLQNESLAAINRSFLPDDLKPKIDAVGIDRTIVVQTQHHLAENTWACGLAEQNHFIAGVVGWVDLASRECASQLEAACALPKFVGVRHVTQDEPDEDFIVRSDILSGLKVLEQRQVPFELLFYAQHLRHATTVASQVPQLPLVIDHLSKPRIKLAELDPWRKELRAAARFPNVFCKLSGMVTEADWQRWTVDDLRPYVEIALEAFGAERCMFGSDWPVCLLAAEYEQVYAAMDELTRELSETEQNWIWGKTAAAFYGLEDVQEEVESAKSR